MQAFLTAKDVATHLGVQPSTIKAWTRDGLIPSIRINSRVIRYVLEDVEHTLRGHQLEAGARPGFTQGGPDLLNASTRRS